MLSHTHPGSTLPGRQLIVCDSIIDCEPFEDRVYQPDINRYIRGLCLQIYRYSLLSHLSSQKFKHDNFK